MKYLRWRSPSGRQSSWHLMRLTRSILPRTMCGREAREGYESQDTLPAGRTCETCFRRAASVQEHAEAAVDNEAVG